MPTKQLLLLYVVLLGAFDAVIPFFPILAIILVYVLLVNPPWFLDTVQKIYRSK